MKLKLGNLGDLIDTDSGEKVRFVATPVHGAGWTVSRVVGSSRTGLASTLVGGYSIHYTMHQAQIAADMLTRDTKRAVVDHQEG